MIQPARKIYIAASLLFVASGATSLAYEVIWFKRFGQAWGQSYYAIALVTAAFLCGLGLGAWAIGKLADRLRVPLMAYAIFEILIGLMALAIPFAIAALRQIPPEVLAPLQDHQFLRYLVRFGLTLAILGPPTILMGGTLPLLVRQFSLSSAAMKDSIGWFYFLNTLGAALGVYLAGFHLLPNLGLEWSNYLVAAVNLTIGGVAGFYALKLRRPEALAGLRLGGRAADPASPHSAAAPLDGSWLRKVYLAAFLVGSAALILQLVWTRQLMLILGTSTYAFTSVLFVVLLGIALGSLIFKWWSRLDRDPFRTMIHVIFALAFFALLGKELVPHLTLVIACLNPLRASQAFSGIASAAAGMFVQFLPALGMGFLFPLLVLMTRRGHADAGRAVGGVYAWNTAGTVLGALVTGSLLLPYIGIHGALALALALYLVALWLLVWPAAPASRPALRLFSLPTLGAIFLIGMQNDPMVLNSGMFLYGYVPPKMLMTHDLLFIEEGSSCNVMVRRNQGSGNTSLHVNGKVDGSSIGDQPTQLGLAYFPHIFMPDARDILVIGFGTGSTSGASLLFPESRVTCAEIEPAILRASQYFNDVNHQPLQHAPDRFRVVIDDGRNFIQSSTQRWDLIISEPSNPWIAGVSNLFTREFYRQAKSHLNDDGILVQWIQLYQLLPEDHAMMLRTIREEFEHCLLLHLQKGDTMLLASRHDLLATDPAVLDRAQAIFDAQPAIQNDLTNHFYSVRNVRQLLSDYLVLDTAGIDRLLESFPAVVANTDYNMLLEYQAPLRLYDTNADSIPIKLNLAIAYDPIYHQQLDSQWSLVARPGAPLQARVDLLQRMGLTVSPEVMQQHLQQRMLELEALRQSLQVSAIPH